MSPEVRMPPSAIAGTPASRQAAAHSSTAVNCGTPTPATTRVVQIEPGPMPIFTPSAPASITASAPSGVATLPAITCTALENRLIAVTASSTPREWPCAVSTTTTSTPASIRARERVGLRLVHVLDRDQPDAAIGIVHHQQFLDAVMVQQAARLVGADAGGDGNEPVPRHQLIDLLPR